MNPVPDSGLGRPKGRAGQGGPRLRRQPTLPVRLPENRRYQRLGGCLNGRMTTPQEQPRQDSVPVLPHLNRAGGGPCRKAAGQIDPSGAAMALSHADQTGARNGGTVRGYQDSSYRWRTPTAADQASSRTVCLCVTSSGRERPQLPRLARSRSLVATGSGRSCLGMTNFTDLTSVPADHPAPFTDQLRLAVAAYLARFTGSSRPHTESDLRCYLSWCAEHDPRAARRPHLELYIRWMQEIRHFKPSTVSGRFSVVAGFYKTCVIDGLREHSPAEHVRRPAVPPELPAPGFTHLQFEALLTAARQSPDRCDFALVAMLGLLGLRIFEATGADITDLGEEHGHRVLRVCGKGTKVVLIPLPPAIGRAIDRATGTRTGGPILLNSRGTRMDPHAATRRLRPWSMLRVCGSPGRTRICSAIPSSRPCWMRAWTCGTSRSPPGTPTRAPRCTTTGPARISTAIRTTSWPPTWPPEPD
jgi:hypothetical protein